jgi:hypothetical protein
MPLSTTSRLPPNRTDGARHPEPMRLCDVGTLGSQTYGRVAH